MSIKITQEESENSEKNVTILLARLGDEKIGVIAYREAENCLPYVYDLVSSPSHPEVAAMLMQRVRKDCKKKGHERVVFTIKPENPALAILVLDGTYRLEEIIASCAT